MWALIALMAIKKMHSIDTKTADKPKEQSQQQQLQEQMEFRSVPVGFRVQWYGSPPGSSGGGPSSGGSAGPAGMPMISRAALT